MQLNIFYTKNIDRTNCILTSQIISLKLSEVDYDTQLLKINCFLLDGQPYLHKTKLCKTVSICKQWFILHTLLIQIVLTAADFAKAAATTFDLYCIVLINN